MVTPLILPAFSLGMKEGTILKWYKKEGDGVEKGEIVVRVFGEKMEVDLDSPEAGVLLKILYGENADVPVSTVIGLIGVQGEDISNFLTQIEKGAATPSPAGALASQQPVLMRAISPIASAPTDIEVASVSTQTPTHLEGRVRASPAARRVAKEKNVDLKKVPGTGPGGRVVAKNVFSYSGPRTYTASARAEAETMIGAKDMRKVKNLVSMSPTRKVIARRMSQSARTAPHISIIMEIDMTEIVKLRERLLNEVEKRSGTKLSYTDIIVKGVAKTLEEFPMVNATLQDENTIRVFDDINIGVAIASKEGLIVPVVRNANKLSIAETSATLNGLIDKAHKGKLTPEEMSGGTFTVTSLGMFGVDVFIPIINPPELGILAVGRINKKPAVDDKGQIVVKPMAFFALAVDHRVVDGAPAAEFLQRVREILEDPFALRY